MGRLWGLGRSAMGLGVCRRAESAKQIGDDELAGKLRDEGDEGAGW